MTHRLLVPLLVAATLSCRNTESPPEASPDPASPPVEAARPTDPGKEGVGVTGHWVIEVRKPANGQ